MEETKGTDTATHNPTVRKRYTPPVVVEEADFEGLALGCASADESCLPGQIGSS